VSSPGAGRELEQEYLVKKQYREESFLSLKSEGRLLRDEKG